VTAVDGPGGAGKSTFAARLSAALGGVPIVHTDDFASWDDPLDWWPRLIEQVLEPLAAGKAARFQRYDWTTRSLDGWREVDAGHVILEGVSANRLAFCAYVGFAIWVETPRPVRLARGLERDGVEMREQWRAWMAAEDDYLARESPDERSDLVVSGLPRTDGAFDRVDVLRRGRRSG
jgi:uridine kinase